MLFFAVDAKFNPSTKKARKIADFFFELLKFLIGFSKNNALR